MNYKIEFPEVIDCRAMLPASKSISNRALIINALSGEQSAIENVAHCDDTDVMIAALASKKDEINVGAAGTAMRFLTSYFAIQEGRMVTIDGSERMRKRPIKLLVDILRLCGAKIEYLGEEGFPPLRIVGSKLKSPAKLEIPGNVSSQYISSLLMIAPYINGGLNLTITGNVLSVPYIDMALSIMRRFGADAKREENQVVVSPIPYKPTQFTVENDWSAASYWYEIVALLPGSRVVLPNLSLDSVQGDSAVSRYYEALGVSSEKEGDGVLIATSGSSINDTLRINLSNEPDIAQTIVVTACLIGRKFVIGGLSSLKIKETDRIEALRNELRKLGYVIDVSDDYSLMWYGNMIAPQHNPVIETYDDHRMAMAIAPAAIDVPDMVIKNVEVVTKSYPQYWDALTAAGVKITEQK